MTVSIAPVNIDYYLSTTANGDVATKRDLTAYYVSGSTPDGVWLGGGLRSLGITAEAHVTTYAARALFEDGVNPLTGERLGRHVAAKVANPNGKTPAGAQAKATRNRVGGFDLTFSVPKSVSALWALGDPHTQGMVYAAHLQAMKDTIGWMETNVLNTRTGHAGIAHEDVTGVIASGYDHWESRNGDPQLHTHLVVSNKVQRVSDGKWSTIDSNTLHKNIVTISETYNSLLFSELSRTLGTQVEARFDGAKSDFDVPRLRYELAGVSDEMIALFSTRSQLIEAEKDRLVREHVQTYGKQPTVAQMLKLRQKATLATRNAKHHDEDSPTLREQMKAWTARAQAAGLNPGQIVGAATGFDVPTVAASDLEEATIAQDAIMAVQSAANRRSSFTRANLTAEVQRLLMSTTFDSPTEQSVAVTRIVEIATRLCVNVTAPRLQVDVQALPAGLLRAAGQHVLSNYSADVFTTQDILERESAVMAMSIPMAGEDAAPHLEDSEEVKAAIETLQTSGGHFLSPDQQAAVHAVATSPASLTAIIGPAGTGKSTTMKGLRTTWEGTFGVNTVIGLAPSAAAAAVLGAEIGTKTDNLAKWVYESVGDGAKRRAETFTAAHERLAVLQARLLLKPGNPRLAVSLRRTSESIARITALQDRYTMKAGQLVIIDEASMASTAALSLVGKQARDAGAKILLVGDPSQLGAIESGGMLGWMERTGQATALTNVFRFENEWEKDASLKLRRGDTRSITAYAKHGRIVAGTEEDLLIRVHDAWRADTLTRGYSSLMIAPDNATVDQLNTMAQAVLRADGKVGEDKTVNLRRGATAGVGDVILARLNDRETIDTTGEFVHNGTLLTVNAVQRDGSVTGTRNDNSATITLSSSYLRESVELGYATTVNRSQGLTVDTAHALITGETSREAAYVAMTRGRKANMAYIIDEEHDDTPDPDGMMREQEAHGATEILAAILKNSNPEILAHEQIIVSQAESMNFERLTSEYDLVSKATMRDGVLTWLHTIAEAEQVAQWQDSPEFTSLVSAWSPSVGALPIDERTTALDVAAALREYNFLNPTELELVGGLSVASPLKNVLTTALESMLEDSLDALVAKTRLDHAGAEWIAAANLREIVAWRAIAGRQFEKTALGDEPKSNDWRMWKYFDHISTPAHEVNINNSAGHTGATKDDESAREPEAYVGITADESDASPRLG